jgi:hypothetical protein
MVIGTASFSEIVRLAENDISALLDLDRDVSDLDSNSDLRDELSHDATSDNGDSRPQGFRHGICHWSTNWFLHTMECCTQNIPQVVIFKASRLISLYLCKI